MAPVMLDPVKALFLCRRDHLPVYDERRSMVL
jgi:hypothetical protein